MSYITCPFCGGGAPGHPCTCGKTWAPGYQPPATPWPLFPAAPQTGWLCPRCGASNGPHVQQCPCGPASRTVTSTTGGTV